MQKTITFAKIAYSGGSKVNATDIQMELKVKDKEVRHWDTLETLQDMPVFSASGHIWNSRKTDCECCGQMIDDLCEYLPTDKKLARIREIWDGYHLNDMNAGTKKQMDFLAQLEANGWKYDYTEACNKLGEAGLFEDRGYKYGHGWLYRPIPDNVLEEIKALIAE